MTMRIGAVHCYSRVFELSCWFFSRIRWACVPDRMSVSWRASDSTRRRVTVSSMAMISLVAIMAYCLAVSRAQERQVARNGKNRRCPYPTGTPPIAAHFTGA